MDAGCRNSCDGSSSHETNIPTSINPYGYIPSMLAAVNALSQDEAPTPMPTALTPLSSYNPVSIPPKTHCPLLALPYEIRALIYSYVLPYTICDPKIEMSWGPDKQGVLHAEKQVIWHRGNTTIMLTCRKLYEECRDILYGSNWFLIDIHFDRIEFNCQWLVITAPSLENDECFLVSEESMRNRKHRAMPMYPSRKIDFAAQFSIEVRRLMKRFVVRMYLVDSYEGMIKFNITNEQVLRRGLVEKFKKLVDGPLPDNDRKMPMVKSKLVGSDAQKEMFITQCTDLMEAVYPGCLSFSVPTMQRTTYRYEGHRTAMGTFV